MAIMKTPRAGLKAKTDADETPRVAGVAHSSLPAETLSWRIVTHIRESLFADELKSGDFLGTEASLAELYGVSRMAARDALRTLAALGVVAIRPGKHGGAWIANGKIDRFADALAIQLKLLSISREEMLETQAAVEIHAAGLAASRSTRDDLLAMQSILDEMPGCISEPAAFAAKALDFHAAIVDAAHNRGLAAHFRALRHVLQPAYSGSDKKEIAQRVIEDNRRLHALIASGNVDGARKAMASRIARVSAAQNWRASAARSMEAPVADNGQEIA